MYSFLFSLLTVGVVLIVSYFMHRRTNDDKPADFEVLQVRFEPPPGTPMTAQQQVVVHMQYRYSSPRQRLLFWVKPLGATQAGSYEPSTNSLSPGTGWVQRYVSLEGEGAFYGVELIVSKRDMSDVYRQELPAEYHYAADPALDALRDDGLGATVRAMRLHPPTGSTVKACDWIEVEIHYDVPGEKGVDLWVHPLTSRRASYSDSTEKVVGQGTLKRSFMVGEACTLDAIDITMRNTAGMEVYRETIAVDYRFV